MLSADVLQAIHAILKATLRNVFLAWGKEILITPIYNKTETRFLYLICFTNIKTVSTQQYLLPQGWHVMTSDNWCWATIQRRMCTQRKATCVDFRLKNNAAMFHIDESKMFTKLGLSRKVNLSHHERLQMLCRGNNFVSFFFLKQGWRKKEKYGISRTVERAEFMYII